MEIQHGRVKRTHGSMFCGPLASTSLAKRHHDASSLHILAWVMEPAGKYFEAMCTLINHFMAKTSMTQSS